MFAMPCVELTLFDYVYVSQLLFVVFVVGIVVIVVVVISLL